MIEYRKVVYEVCFYVTGKKYQEEEKISNFFKGKSNQMSPLRGKRSAQDLGSKLRD